MLMTTTVTRTACRLLPVCIGAALLTAATVARAETVDQLYEKAKAEKSLVFYAGGPTAPYEARIKLFQEKFPGIQVSVSGLASGELEYVREADGSIHVTGEYAGEAVELSG
jgi:ABC-type molybdate transport system substrate-binding protein